MPAILTEHTQFTDSAGKPFVNGTVTYGVQGADPDVSPITIYSDRGLTTVITNPQVLDANGRTANKVWVAGRYSILVKDLNDAQVYTNLDNGETADKGITVLENVSGGNTIVATASSTITAYEDLEQYTFRTASVNTGAVTLNIDTVGAKSVVKNNIDALVSGDFAADQNIIVSYNLTDDVFEWVNQNVRFASQAEVDAGTEATKIVSPLTLANYNGLGLAGYLNELTLSNNAIDAAKDLDIAPGIARDSTNVDNIVLASALTKQIDAVWAVGTNAGGLDTGTVAASTWYYVWLIKRSDTDVVDALFSLSATAPTMPANYDLKRRIGAILTDATPDIIGFIQSADTFTYKTPIVDVSTAAQSTTAILNTLSIPVIECEAILFSAARQATGNLFSMYVSDPDLDDLLPTGEAADANFAGQVMYRGSTSGTSGGGGMYMRIRSDSGQVRTRASSALTAMKLQTHGWVDRRGA